MICLIISGKRIINVDRYLSEFKDGDDFYVGVNNVDMYKDRFRKYGMPCEVSGNCSFIPRPITKLTDYNANGRWVIDKTLQLEDRTFETEYHIVDWHGNDHYGTRYYSKPCYQRKLLPPPEIELTYTNGMLISPLLTKTEDDNIITKHIINIFLEIFGICETFTENIETIKKIKVERLPWTVLPKGEYPWKKAKEHLGDILKGVPDKHKIVISNRHEAITYYKPDFMAIGDESFWGYVIYGFVKKDLYVFESNKPDNATYFFNG